MADTKKKLQQGWLHVLVTFEIIGTPKEHVDQSLRGFLDTVKADERIEWIEEHIEPAEKSEKEDFYGAFAEVDLLAKNLDTLMWLAINFTPASIEVIEPNSFTFKALDIQNWMNDLLSKLHTIGMDYKQQINKADFFRINLMNLIENTILLSLARHPKQIPELSKDTSLTEDALKEHVEKLIKNKKIIEKKGVYELA